jgi:hypothetical protein
MEQTTKMIPMAGDDRLHLRMKHRLYFIIQAVVWGGLLLPTLGVLVFHFGELKPNSYLKLHPVTAFAAQSFPFLAGFVLTHFSRVLIEKWKWKRLGPGQLLPRASALSLTQGLIVAIGLFAAANWANHGGIKFFPGSILAWVIFSLLFAAWISAYFLYHVFERSTQLETDSLRLAARAQEAELAALRSQLNPHFIFNSLNSLRALIEDEPARARLAVTELANLLRYSLQSSQHDTVPLEDELRMAQDYLSIEQMRFEERLQVVVEIAPEARAFRVPPMLLQTLVENAVKYGIAEEEHGGTVSISARVVAERLHLRVTNPGTLDQRGQTAGKSTGVGLRNAAERLRLLFGPQSELVVGNGGPHLVVAEAFVTRELASERSP